MNTSCQARPAIPAARRGQPCLCRSGSLILRTGSPWRDLPHELGNWHSTYVRFARWRGWRRLGARG
ncbi:MAG: transposase [Rhodocyclaceae bacterium]|nr:transposase [Rhodocyclaceae bacterium]